MKSHIKTCYKVKEKLKSSSDSNYDDSLLTVASIASIMDSCCSYDSYSSSSDYSGGGGSFDGGGSSGDW